MTANIQKQLSLHANKLIMRASRVVASILRAGHARHRWMAVHATQIRNKATLHLAMLRRLAMHKNVVLAGLSSLSTAIALSEFSGRAPRTATMVVEPAQLTIKDHWQRVTGVINAALESFQRIKSLHAAAARQIDSADYALTQLLHDLRPAMALPADVSGLRAILAEAERTAPTRIPPARQVLAA
jgi:hypothetical protein